MSRAAAIQVETLDAIAIVRLDHGKANALDIELVRSLAASLRAIEDSPAKAIVLTIRRVEVDLALRSM